MIGDPSHCKLVLLWKQPIMQLDPSGIGPAHAQTCHGTRSSFQARVILTRISAEKVRRTLNLIIACCIPDNLTCIEM
jgi:hypothetical protein